MTKYASTSRFSGRAALAASLLAAASCAFEPGVEEEAVPTTLESVGDHTLAASDHTQPQTMLVFGAPNSATAPVLAGLATDHETTTISAAMASAPLSELETALEGVDVLGLDLEALSTDELQDLLPLIEEARAQGIPLVLENIADPEAMAALIGIGFASDAALIELDPTRTRSTVHLYGEHTETSEGQLDENDDEEDSFAVEIENPLPTDESAEEVTAPTDDFAPPVEMANIESELRAQLRTTAAQTGTIMFSSSLPPRTYHSYTINRQAKKWYPGSKSQKATMDQDFEIELFAASDTGKKYMITKGIGSGFNPTSGSSLWKNNDDYRAYYLEYAKVWIKPGGNALSTYRHAPQTTNGSSTYSTSIGYSIGGGIDASGPTTSFSVSGGTTASQTLTDFVAIDESYDDITKWKFMLSSVDGNPYDTWKDLVDTFWGDLYGLPHQAKSNLQVDFESIYRVDKDFDDVVPVEFGSKLNLRRVKGWQDWFTYYTVSSQSYRIERSHFSIDFSKVGVPENGTIPFQEDWKSGTAGWQLVNEGQADLDSDWETWNDTAVQQTGNAYDRVVSSDGVIDLHGAYLWQPTTFFGQGDFSTRTWTSDNDGQGLMYGIQDYNNYYRFMMDAQKSYARLVKVKDGIFTELDADLNFMPPLGTWNDVRIQRSGTSHRVYINDVLVLSAVDGDSELTSGAIGLFTWGMSNAYFDNIEVKP